MMTTALRTLLLSTVFCALTFLVPPAWGAPADGITIIPSTAPNVSLILLDSAKVDSRFVDLFKQKGADWAYFRPFTVVISNQTAQPVKALTIAWTITDSNGQEKTTYTSEGRYMFDAGTVSMQPESQSLLLPSLGYVNVILAGNPRATIATPAKPLIDEFNRAAKVTVELDALIFQNGQVWGPDRSRTVKNLETRDAVTRTFSKRVKDVLAAGEDLAAFLASLSALSPALQTEADWQAQVNASVKEKESDLFNFWLARHARASQQSAAPMNAINRMDSIPPLPKFYRETAR